MGVLAARSIYWSTPVRRGQLQVPNNAVGTARFLQHQVPTHSLLIRSHTGGCTIADRNGCFGPLSDPDTLPLPAHQLTL